MDRRARRLPLTAANGKIGHPGPEPVQVYRVQSWYTPRHSNEGSCFRSRHSRYRARQVFMHCCLAVRAAANVRGARFASCAWSLPILKDRGTARSAQMTASDCSVNFMAQLSFGSKSDQRRTAGSRPTSRSRSARHAGSFNQHDLNVAAASDLAAGGKRQSAG
jgi:hypothetical protein